MNTLYKHYDKDDNLLYIGVTCNLKQRSAAHKYGSPWFVKVTRISTRHFGSRRSALKEEIREIGREVPCCNCTNNIVTEAYLEMKYAYKTTQKYIRFRTPLFPRRSTCCLCGHVWRRKKPQQPIHCPKCHSTKWKKKLVKKEINK